MDPIQKVWQITDLNNNFCFQHLVGLAFYRRYETGLTKYNDRNGSRMRIQVCKFDPKITAIQVVWEEKTHSLLF